MNTRKTPLIFCAALFAALTIASVAPAEASLSLKPNQPPDGIGLAWDKSPSAQVTGYRLYQGGETGNYTNVVDVKNVLNTTVTGLKRGTKPIILYFAVTAYDAEGLESNFSNEVSYEIKPLPEPPGNVTKTNTIVRVSVETAPNPKGPWGIVGSAELELTPFKQRFYRSIVNVEPFREMDQAVYTIRTAPPELPLK